MKTKLLFMGVTITALSLFSCNQEDVYDISNEELSQSSVNNSARVTEGIIPFTVENVSQALPKVLDYYREHRPEVAERFANYKVEPTHIYYKFTPADSLQYSVLMENDNELQLTSDPFEFTPQERTEDPAENEIPSFYAVVSKEVGIPDVPHEKIALLHFTDEDKLKDAPHNYDEVEFKQNLMYETRKIAGHLDEEELAEGYMNYNEGIDERETHNNGGEMSTYGLFGKKWRPSGNVSVEEDVVRLLRGTRHNEPVKGARLNVLKWGWLQIEHGTTDVNGNFSTGTTYTTYVHYKVKFKHNNVTVKDNNFYNTAEYFSGKHKRAALIVSFSPTNLARQHFFALIHNASYDYYNRCLSLYGLHSPGNLNITAQYNGSGSDSGAQWYPFNSAIRISRLSGSTYRGSDGIYATTIHELTHSGHRKMDSGMFSWFHDTNKERLLMTESWAEGVETILTNDRYNNLFATNRYGIYRGTNRNNTNALTQGWNGFRQHRTALEMDEYTPLVIDLVDNLNQNTLNTLNNLPVDMVSGYTLSQIQFALKTSRTLNTWENRLKTFYTNPTKNNVNTVFDYAREALANRHNWN